MKRVLGWVWLALFTLGFFVIPGPASSAFVTSRAGVPSLEVAPVGTAPAPEPPVGVPHPELVPGDVFEDFGVAAEVPPSGRFVGAATFVAQGAGQSVAIFTDDAGNVSVFEEGPEGSEPKRRPNGDPQDECNDGESELHSWWWSQTFQWWFKVATTPSEITQDAARDGLRDATVNITTVNNVCGHGDAVSAATAFQGDTTTSVDMNNAHTCQSTGDSKSVTSFGTLDSNVLGLTCVWGNGILFPTGGIADESDMKLNKADYTWVVNIGGGCSNKISVRGVATHERGHTYGIAHVDPVLHPALTMRGGGVAAVTCTEILATLGLGEWIGLEIRY